MRIKIFLLALLSISGICSLQNGEIAGKGKFSYVVAIWVDRSFASEYYCSGVILSKNYILTTGHCVHDINAHNIIVTSNVEGSTFLEYPVNYVDTIILHPDFRKVSQPDKPLTEYWIHDIAILKLMCALTLTPILGAIGLVRRRYSYNNEDNCFIAGWTPTIKDSELHLVLSWVDAKVFCNEIVQSTSFLLPNEKYAFLTQSRALIDDMDTGNALICGGIAVGIITGGRDRTRSVVSVLTLAPYQKFISNIIRMSKTVNTKRL